MHGVLKSWAVPKGIPYEPGVRRLATETEDHPIEYLDFEGIIPEGQYGGGTVLVWDIGTYEVIEGNYWKGFLHLSLSGKKLKGEWTLQRDPSKGPNSWIIEKVGSPIKAISAKKEDQSALTGRTMAEVAEARDAEWQSNRSAASASENPRPAVAPVDIDLSSLPPAEAKFIEPMQCKVVSNLPEARVISGGIAILRPPFASPATRCSRSSSMPFEPVRRAPVQSKAGLPPAGSPGIHFQRV
jgi:bifunctional non-homologous end joining protein LigD